MCATVSTCRSRLRPLALKNIARPVEAFVLRLDPGAAKTPAAGVATNSVQPAQPSTWVRLRAALIAAVVGLLVCGALGAWWWLQVGGTAAAPQAPEGIAGGNAQSANLPRATTQALTPLDVGLAKAPRLSIVVLPFENLERRSERGLPGRRHHRRCDHRSSRVPGMFVIARDSAFTYQGKAVDVRKVGEELGVRYVLEGSVRKLGDMLRVNAQLIATETGAHLWADRFDQKLNDLSAGQEAIVRRELARP